MPINKAIYRSSARRSARVRVADEKLLSRWLIIGDTDGLTQCVYPENIRVRPTL